MKCLGIDPDLHDTALAILELNTEAILNGLVSKTQTLPTILDLTTASISSDFTGQEAVIKMIIALEHEISTFIGLHSIDLCIIEGQQKYFGTSPARIEDIIQGAHISGAAAAYFIANTRDSALIIPTPNTWKGSIPKSIHQARIINSLGWKVKKIKSHSYPLNPPEKFQFTSEKWKHIIDAIGLAWWGLKQSIKVVNS